jgi:hypothetical protein
MTIAGRQPLSSNDQRLMDFHREFDCHEIGRKLGR